MNDEEQRPDKTPPKAPAGDGTPGDARAAAIAAAKAKAAEMAASRAAGRPASGPEGQDAPAAAGSRQPDAASAPEAAAKGEDARAAAIAAAKAKAAEMAASRAAGRPASGPEGQDAPPAAGSRQPDAASAPEGGAKGEDARAAAIAAAKAKAAALAAARAKGGAGAAPAAAGAGAAPGPRASAAAPGARPAPPPKAPPPPPPLDPVLAPIREFLEKALAEVTFDQRTFRIIGIEVGRDHLLDVAQRLRDMPETRMDYLACLSGVDYPDGIEVVYHLASTQTPAEVALRVKVGKDEAECHVPSVTGIWPGANWHEREAFDLLGVRFQGHPDLRRILLPEDFSGGYPLRKDFQDTREAREIKVRVR